MKSWHYVLIALALVVMGYAYWTLTTSGAEDDGDPREPKHPREPKKVERHKADKPDRTLPRRVPLRPKKPPFARKAEPSTPLVPPKDPVTRQRQLAEARDDVDDFVMKLDAQIERVGDRGLSRDEWLKLYEESLPVMEGLIIATTHDARKYNDELQSAQEAVRQRLAKLERK